MKTGQMKIFELRSNVLIVESRVILRPIVPNPKDIQIITIKTIIVIITITAGVRSGPRKTNEGWAA